MKQMKAIHLEDVDDRIRSFFLDSPTRQDLSKNTYRHKSIYITSHIGRILIESFFDLELSDYTLSGRLKSFPGNWRGPPPLEMALAGFNYIDTERVTCFNCRLEIRTQEGENTCPWTSHKTFAPNCAHLRRYHVNGFSSLKEGKRINRNSSSDTYRLIK
ncbi:uncharacterized protein LOC112566357 [Pomacea canaliculata]|uniref:uncharacterized protein LOC112566357 n=1 Tax=Pomacea canaliculata TaxID=400727 RepID=UPI000D72BFEF|nr:uncharacterized protein LOC112566357 [Pomacea canaliculata]XP_025098298.1 uncharacterized protein LOC112566357 [Pomacea canaliculata]